MGVRTAIYLRISRDEEKKGKGVDRQLAKCREQLAKLGWTETEVFSENDTSATRRKPRPLYEAMLGKIRAGEFDAVIGYAQDRLTRKPTEAEALIDLIKGQGLRVATSAAGELMVANDPDAEANFRNSTTGAAREVAWIKKRVADKCAQRAGEGMPQGMVPFGWDAEIELDSKGRFLSSRYVLNDAEAGLIRDAAQDILAGLSLRSVVAKAEAGAIRPARGGKWTANQLRAVLLRPSNAKIRMYKGTVAAEGDDVQWPAILDVTTHQRLVSLFADANRATNYRGYRPSWLLSGIAVCGHCGNTKINVVTGGSRGRRPAYTCVGHKPQACFARSWTDDVDGFVALAVKTKLESPEFAKPTTEVAEQIDTHYARIGELEAEQKEIAGMLGDGLTLAQIRIMSTKLGAQITQLDSKIKALLPKVATEFTVPWDEADLDQRRVMIRKLTSQIKLSPMGHGKSRVFTPDQVKIEWR